MRRHLIFWTVLWGAAACSDGGGGPDYGPVPSLKITNRSQYTLMELRAHASEGYLNVMNALPEPLAIEEDVVFYGLGQHWFTVMREKSERGQILAFTTAEPVQMYRNQGWVMTVHDEAFRVTADTYVRPDRYEGVILGDPGPPCEWTSTATKSDCPEDMQ